MALDWTIVAETARSLGVTPSALKKWRQRGSVPHKWRLPLIRGSEGQLPVDAFDAGEAPAEDARA